MAAYLTNGAQLGWLLFPQQRAVEIWQPGDGPAAPVVMERIEAAEALEGGELLPGLLPGLRLELAEIWEG
jgi:Uma2 family endonuclease